MAKKNAKNKEAQAPKSVQNRRARHDYAIEYTYEAGIALVGSEVKSVFKGRANLTDAYCRVQNGEMWLYNADIEPYEQTSAFPHERRRDRKLLLHKKEIAIIDRRSMEKGFTIVPLAMYFKNGKVKVEIALARGRAQYDKRDQIQRDETRREARDLRDL